MEKPKKDLQREGKTKRAPYLRNSGRSTTRRGWATMSKMLSGCGQGPSREDITFNHPDITCLGSERRVGGKPGQEMVSLDTDL